MSKFMTKLENILMSEGLTENTASQYVKRIMLLNNGKKFTSIAFLRKPKDIMEYMRDDRGLSASSMESYLCMIISVLGKMPSKMNDKARKEYEAIMEKPDDYFKKRDRGEKTENQEKGWVDKETFEKYVEEAKEKGLTASRKTKNFTTKDYNAVLEYFLISLYTLLPPRRNKDYQLMKVDTEEGNRLDTKTKQFIFTDYKPSGKYG